MNEFTNEQAVILDDFIKSIISPSGIEELGISSEQISSVSFSEDELEKGCNVDEDEAGYLLKILAESTYKGMPIVKLVSSGENLNYYKLTSNAKEFIDNYGFVKEYSKRKESDRRKEQEKNVSNKMTKFQIFVLSWGFWMTLGISIISIIVNIIQVIKCN